MQTGILREVPIRPLPLERFAPLIGEAAMAEARRAAVAAERALRGRTLWVVNSTAAGGGVAEMLPHLLGYAAGVGISVRWLVIGGDPLFFTITKRLHNGLHGSPGDEGLLGKAEEEHYTAVADENLRELLPLVRPGDAALIHDPQPAALIPRLKTAGLGVIWRCHIGQDAPTELGRRSWAFLEPYVSQADALCFTRASYAPDWVDRHKLYVVQPSIDPFSAKNQDMSAATAETIVAHLGLVSSRIAAPCAPTERAYLRSDGALGSIERHADIVRSGQPPPPTSPMVVQVSRWDRLKDMAGVMRGFTEGVPASSGAHLALVGPAVHGVSDDPEGAGTFDHCLALWRQLPHFARCRVQLVTLPMTDVEENAAMVNAIQRHAAVIVQKSLKEGFGLSITEAMWKARPVLASAVGGIQDQIVDGDNGRLVHDPSDLGEFGAALRSLLDQPDAARTLGSRARETVRERFLPPRHLEQFAAIIVRLFGEGDAARRPIQRPGSTPESGIFT